MPFLEWVNSGGEEKKQHTNRVKPDIPNSNGD